MISDKKKSIAKTIFKIIYWISLFGITVYLGFHFHKLLVYSDYAQVNSSFDLQSDFYDNFDVFSDAADLLWNHPLIFCTESRSRGALFFFKETFSEEYSFHHLDKIITQEEWNVLEKLNKIKKIAYIDYDQGDIPYIMFDFTIIDKGRKGGVRLYCFNTDEAEHINNEYKDIVSTDKAGWFFEEYWSV